MLKSFRARCYPMRGWRIPPESVSLKQRPERTKRRPGQQNTVPFLQEKAYVSVPGSVTLFMLLAPGSPRCTVQQYRYFVRLSVADPYRYFVCLSVADPLV
jgi:hypothetical protein